MGLELAFVRPCVHISNINISKTSKPILIKISAGALLGCGNGYISRSYNQEPLADVIITSPRSINLTDSNVYLIAINPPAAR